MNKNKLWMAVILAASIIGPAYANTNVDVNVNYSDRNIFNRFTDWTVSIGRGQEERQRIIDHRIEMRAQQRREYWERRHAHDHDRDHHDQYDHDHHDDHDHDHDHR